MWQGMCVAGHTAVAYLAIDSHCVGVGVGGGPANATIALDSLGKLSQKPVQLCGKRLTVAMAESRGA